MKVLYGGTELFDDEVRKTFHSDMLLALFSGGCITVLVYVLTSFSGKTLNKHSNRINLKIPCITGVLAHLMSLLFSQHRLEMPMFII